jgi:hypothetical protein
MYFSDFTFNKSKDRTLIFIHGAYGTAGYWLPYLKVFNNYKIIVLNMNYSAILNTNKDLNLTKLLLEKYVLEHNLVAVISHSLGTIFSNIFNINNQVLNFNICPMVYSERTNIDNFNIELQSRINSKGVELRTNANLTVKLIEDSKSFISDRIFYLIPQADNFFIYDFPFSIQKIYFTGNHFEIENALNIIATNLVSEI